MRRARLLWAKKLLKAKYFVVLTDKESVIALDGADPNSFVDVLALTAQSAEVNDFYEILGELVKDHAAAIKALTGEADAEVSAKKSPSVRKPAKRKVVSG